MEYGLIGEKLGHSASKEIHERLADYTYEPHPLTREEFPEFMQKKEFRAINVTIPYKQEVIPYLAAMDESASAIGAVNTIVNRDGQLYGYNTDMPGFIYMVQKNGIDMRNKKVIILGNGGLPGCPGRRTEARSSPYDCGGKPDNQKRCHYL